MPNSSFVNPSDLLGAVTLTITLWGCSPGVATPAAASAEPWTFSSSAQTVATSVKQVTPWSCGTSRLVSSMWMSHKEEL